MLYSAGTYRRRFKQSVRLKYSNLAASNQQSKSIHPYAPIQKLHDFPHPD